MDRYQWTVLFAAWLGWGFDVFDGILFNFVAPTCVPALLGLTVGTPEAKSATQLWVGVMSATLLVGWAIGGIGFGRVADQLGRTRTLLLTMAVYSLGTAMCAFAPNLWVLLACRAVASLGIGGEWAAGASMVAEVVPEKRRVEAGALLYTSAPLGVFFATNTTWLIQGVALRARPDLSWRAVFLCGLLPAAVAVVVRAFVHEPERWTAVAARALPPKLSDLWTPEMRERTLSGLAMASVVSITWWSCNAFIAIIAAGLADRQAGLEGLSPEAAVALKESWKALSANVFNLGGLIGTLLTVPIAKSLGRKPMFGLYFLGSALAIAGTFVPDLAPSTRLYLYFPIGLTTFGVFGAFTYYLPELFPTRLRSTGAGFCYNAGRLLAAVGTFGVGYVASLGKGSLEAGMTVLAWVSVVPLVGVALLPFAIETKDHALQD